MIYNSTKNLIASSTESNFPDETKLFPIIDRLEISERLSMSGSAEVVINNNNNDIQHHNNNNNNNNTFSTNHNINITSSIRHCTSINPVSSFSLSSSKKRVQFFSELSTHQFNQSITSQGDGGEKRSMSNNNETTSSQLASDSKKTQSPIGEAPVTTGKYVCCVFHFFGPLDFIECCDRHQHNTSTGNTTRRFSVGKTTGYGGSHNSNNNNSNNTEENQNKNVSTSSPFHASRVSITNACTLSYLAASTPQQQDDVFKTFAASYTNNNSFLNNIASTSPVSQSTGTTFPVDQEQTLQDQQALLDRSAFIAELVLDEVIRPTGAHLIEYRNDTFVICLKVSSKNTVSRLASRLVEKLFLVSEKAAQHPLQEKYNVVDPAVSASDVFQAVQDFREKVRANSINDSKKRKRRSPLLNNNDNNNRDESTTENFAAMKPSSVISILKSCNESEGGDATTTTALKRSKNTNTSPTLNASTATIFTESFFRQQNRVEKFLEGIDLALYLQKYSTVSMTAAIFVDEEARLLLNLDSKKQQQQQPQNVSEMFQALLSRPLTVFSPAFDSAWTLERNTRRYLLLRHQQTSIELFKAQQIMKSDATDLAFSASCTSARRRSTSAANENNNNQDEPSSQRQHHLVSSGGCGNPNNRTPKAATEQKRRSIVSGPFLPTSPLLVAAAGCGGKSFSYHLLAQAQPIPMILNSSLSAAQSITDLRNSNDELPGQAQQQQPQVLVPRRSSTPSIQLPPSCLNNNSDHGSGNNNSFIKKTSRDDNDDDDQFSEGGAAKVDNIVDAFVRCDDLGVDFFEDFSPKQLLDMLPAVPAGCGSLFCVTSVSDPFGSAFTLQTREEQDRARQQRRKEQLRQQRKMKMTMYQSELAKRHSIKNTARKNAARVHRVNDDDDDDDQGEDDRYVPSDSTHHHQQGFSVNSDNSNSSTLPFWEINNNNNYNNHNNNHIKFASAAATTTTSTTSVNNNDSFHLETARNAISFRAKRMIQQTFLDSTPGVAGSIFLGNLLYEFQFEYVPFGQEYYYQIMSQLRILCQDHQRLRDQRVQEIRKIKKRLSEKQKQRTDKHDFLHQPPHPLPSSLDLTVAAASTARPVNNTGLATSNGALQTTGTAVAALPTESGKLSTDLGTINFGNSQGVVSMLKCASTIKSNNQKHSDLLAQKLAAIAALPPLPAPPSLQLSRSDEELLRFSSLFAKRDVVRVLRAGSVTNDAPSETKY
jgi:hypothetical protein